MNFSLFRLSKLRTYLFLTLAISFGLLILALPTYASTLPEVDNITVSGTYINDYSFSHTGTSSGESILAVVLVSHRYDALGGVESVTYGGETMTLASTTGEGLAYVYYLADAPSGTQTVALDILNAAYLAGRPVIATAITITGADMENPIDSLARSDGASDNTIDTTITTTRDNVLILDVMGASTGNDPTVSGTGHVSIQDGTYSYGIYGFGYKEATTAGNHTLGWTTSSQSNDFGLALVGIAPKKVMAEIDNTTVSSTYTNDYSFSHTGGSGSDLLAVVLVSHRYDALGGVVSVTYGGETMTLASTTGEGLAYVYYLADAPSGTQTVALDILPAAYAAGRPVKAAAITITGADMNNPIDSLARYDGASDNTIDATITTTQDEVLVLDVLGASTGTNPSPSGTGHVTILDGTYSLGIYGFGYKEATTAGNHTLGWTTSSQSNDFGLALVGITPQ